MNKFVSSIILTLILSLNFVSTYASENIGNKITITNIVHEKVNIGDIFNYFADYYTGIPESYKYINVNYKDVVKGSKLEESLQKLMYLDLIKNPKIQLNKNKELNAWTFYKLSEKIFNITIINTEAKELLQSRKTTNNDFLTVSYILGNKNININTDNNNSNLTQKLEILNDVYNTITNEHYDKEKIDEATMVQGAISGLAEGTKDKHTVYFPPLESKSFQDGLSGDYEGIGAYVDMEKPGKVRIISPIPGSPSEKSGLKGGDKIIKVDLKEVTKDNSLNEVISWIKGPSGTTVTLTIDRNGEIKEIKVIRERIIIKDIESEVINNNTYYIQIKSFGENVSNDFKKTLVNIKEQKNINKIIIDVRNNGGGYLTEVAEILSYFVEEGKNTAVVKYHDNETNYTSKGYNFIDFSKYKIIILQNSGTASASEILIGTLKDYYPNLVLVGENTYGKGSVQVLKNYIDGSILKYTIAKWFTGLTETGIDGVGIKPTIEIELDIENFNTNGVDNQLNKALSIN
ncbi:MAG: S41 family peptidase [Candidatus Gracilibacteria bacterium]|nr:S41 family peptidase [Candidatus Gracilibacteria bacterium]